MKPVVCSLRRILFGNKRVFTKKVYTLSAVAVYLLSASAVLFPSCKAWRTITTTSTYQQANDSVKSSVTITSKTVEEYQGIRKK